MPNNWPNRGLSDLIGIDLPIIQAPMAGANGSAMAIAVCQAGELGSLPCAMADSAKVRAEIGIIRQHTARPLNVNFFCHTPAKPDAERDAAWKALLSAYFNEFGLAASAVAPAAQRVPFDEEMCEVVEDLAPEVVDAVKVPVIAAGGIADGRGIAAAFALGASGVQVGTAYLFTPESLISDLHRAALHSARDGQTALTNLFSGRPARGLMNRLMREIGPMSDAAPAFPTAGGATESKSRSGRRQRFLFSVVGTGSRPWPRTRPIGSRYWRPSAS